MKKYKLILLIALLHMIISCYLFAMSIEIGMRGFDSGEPSPIWAKIIGSIAGIQVMWPFTAPLTKIFGKKLISIFPGYTWYFVQFFNSLVWISALWYVLSYIIRQFSSKKIKANRT